MQRDHQRIAKPEGPYDQEAHVKAEKRQRHVGPHGARDHEAAQAGDKKSEPDRLSPLAGGDPAKAARRHNEQCQIGGIEDVLVLPTDREFARDGDACCQRRHGQMVRAQEHTEAGRRHERA